MSLCRYVDRHVASVNRFDSMRELNVTNKSIVSYLSSFATQRAGWTRSPHTTLEKINNILRWRPQYAGGIWKNTALFLRLGLPSTLIRQEYRDFRKHSSSNISNTRDCVSSGYPSTENRVENTTAQRSIFGDIRSVWIADETLSRLFDISSRSKQKLRSKRRSKIVKIYAKLRPRIQTTVTVVIFFVLSVWIINEFEKRKEYCVIVWDGRHLKTGLFENGDDEIPPTWPVTVVF